MSTRYWKANAETSAQIIKHLAARDQVFAKARKLCRKLGANKKGGFYFVESFGRTYITGLRFDQDPPAGWVRLKRTDNGWRPGAKSEHKQLVHDMISHAIHDICDLIGMKLMGPNLNVRHPAVRIVDKTVYLETPEDVTAKGCRRISDLTYERATKPKRVKAGSQ